MVSSVPIKSKNRIKALRGRSRLTQAELALLMHRDISLVNRHEQGKRPLNVSDIRAYARIFKCETYELFSEPLDATFPDNLWNTAQAIEPPVPTSASQPVPVDGETTSPDQTAQPLTDSTNTPIPIPSPITSTTTELLRVDGTSSATVGGDPQIPVVPAPTVSEKPNPIYPPYSYEC